MNKFFAMFLGLLLLTILAAQSLQAAVLNWDGNESIIDWASENTSTLNMNWLSGGNWDDGSTSGPLATWTDGDDAVFGGSTAGQTITAGTLTVGNMTFGGGPYGYDNSGAYYTISGGTITLLNSTITTNTNTTITSILAGTTGLIKSGSGTLILTGANTYTGTTTISQGTLQLGDGITQPAIRNTYDINSGATLRIQYTSAGATGWTTGASGTWSKFTGGGTLALTTGKNNDAGYADPAYLSTNFYGTLQIEKGRVHASSATSLGGTQSIVVQSGGQFANWDGGTFTQSFSIAGTGYGEANYDGAMRLGNTTLNGYVNLTGNASIGSGGTAIFTNGISESTAGSGLTFGNTSLTSTVELRGMNSYTGTTTVSYGTVVIGSTLIASSGSIYGGTIANTLTNNGTLKLASSIPHSIISGGSITGSGALYVGSFSEATLSLDGGSISTTRTTAPAINLGSLANQPGTLNVNSGTITATGASTIIGDLAVGKWNQSGGTATLGAVILANQAGSEGSSLSLTGGTLATSGISALRTATVNLDGGTLQATGSTTGFWNNNANVTATIGASNITIDTQAYNNTITQVLGGAGGVTKIGSGTLILAGANTYTGTTSVASGSLYISELSKTQSVTVADNATLVLSGSTGSTLALSNMTLGSTLGGSGAFLSFGNLTNGAAPLISVGNLTTNAAAGGIQLNILGANYNFATPPTPANPAIYPLISYTTIGGNGASAFALGALPRNLAASLVNAGNTESLKITGFNPTTWVGNVSNVWDVNTTANWTLGGIADVYQDGDIVLFDDTASGTGDVSVSLTTTVTPSKMTVNSTRNYTIGGTGGIIAGAGPLVKSGSGTLVLTGANSYTGGTTINNGTLQLGDGTANGTLGSGTYTIASGAKLYLNYLTAVKGVGAAPWWGNISGAGTLELNTAPATTWGNLNWGPDSSSATAFSTAFTGTLQMDKGRMDANPTGLGGISNLVINSGGQFMAWSGTYNVPLSLAGNGAGESGQPGAIRVPSGANVTWTAPITLTADAGLYTQDSGSTLNLNGSITGNFAAIFESGGTINVAPAGSTQNNYLSTQIGSSLGGTGGSTVAGNALAFSTGGLNMVGGTLKVNGFDFSFANLTGTAGTVGNYHASTPSTVTLGDATTNAYAFSGTLRDGGAATLGLTKVGASTQELGGAGITYTGPTTLTNGTLALTNASAFGSNVTFDGANAVTLQLKATATTDSWTFSKQLNGGSTLAKIEKIGLGKVVLNPASDSSFVAGASNPLTVTAGSLYVNGAFATAPAVAVAGGATLGGTNTVGTVTVADTGNIVGGGTTGSGTLTADSITFANTGSVSLTANSQYLTAAAVNVTGVNGLTASGAANSIAVNLSGTIPLGTSTYHVMQYAGSDIQGTGFSAFYTGTMPPIGGAGGSYTLALDTVNHYVNLIAVKDGLYWTGNNGTTWDTSSTTPQNWKLISTDADTPFAASYDVLFNDHGLSPQTLTVNVATAAVSPASVNFNNNNVTYVVKGAYAITGAIPLNKDGTGTAVLTGPNNYSGGTFINAGTLQIGDGTGTYGTATNGTIGSGNYTIASGATLKLNYLTTSAPSWAKISGPGTLALKTMANKGDWGQAALPTAFTGTLQIESGRVSTGSGSGIGSATAVVVKNGGQFGNWNNGTWPQAFTIEGTGYGEPSYEVAVRFGGSTTLNGPVTLTGDTAIGGGGTINGIISETTKSNLTLGAGLLGGTMTFAAANTYTGDTIISYDSVRLNNQLALQFSTLDLTSNNASNVIYSSTVAGNAFTLGGLKGNRPMVLQNNASTPAAVAVSVGNNNADTTYSGTLSGPGSLVKIGTGTLTLTGVGSTAGQGLAIQNGVVRGGAANGLPNAPVIFGSATTNGTLDLGGYDQKVASLAIDASVPAGNYAQQIIGNSSTANNATLTFAGAAGVPVTFDGVIKDSLGSGTKTTALSITSGSLTLTGANTYTGGTTISNTGTFVIPAGNVRPGTITVGGSTAYLTGNGTASGIVNVGSSGHLKPYDPLNSTATFTAGTLNLNTGAVLDFNIGTPGISDLINATTLNVASGISVDLNDYTNGSAGNGTYNLIHYSGSITGFSPSAFSVAVTPLSGKLYAFSNDTANHWVKMTISDVMALWTGGSPLNANWKTGANWYGNRVPVANDVLTFDGFSQTTCNNDFAANTQFNGFTFTNQSGAFTLGGNAVKLGGDIVNNSSYGQTIALPLVLVGGSRTVNAAIGDVILTGVVSENGGSYGLLKSGSGNLILTDPNCANNSYTGPTQILSGKVQVAALANGNTPSPIGASSNVAANLEFNGGALEYTGSSVSTDRLFTLGVNGGTILANGVTYYDSGAITFANTGAIGLSGPGARLLTLGGTNTGDNTLACAIGDNGGATAVSIVGGTWILAGANTYTGDTTVTSSTLKAASSAGVGHGNLTLTGGTLDLNGFDVAVSGFSMDGTSTIVNNSPSPASISLGRNNALVTLPAGALNDTVGGGTIALTKEGTAELALTGTNAYSGGTTIYGGTVSFSSTASIGSGTITLAGGSLRQVGGTPLSNSIVLAADTSSFLLTNDITLTGSLSGSGTVTKPLSNSIRLQNDNSALSGTYVNQTWCTMFKQTSAGSALATWVNEQYLITEFSGDGTVQLGALKGTSPSAQLAAFMNGTTAGTKTFEIGAANLSTTYAGRISNVYEHGAGGTDIVALSKVGTGTLTLTGELTYTGDTKVNAGVLIIAGPGLLNTPTANVSVALDATLNASSIVCNTLTIGGAPSAAAAVPEPGTMAMLVLAAIGLIGLAIRRRR